MKKITYAAFPAAAASAEWSDALTQAAPQETKGLNLLFAASQIKTTPEDEDEGKGAKANGAKVQASSRITVVSKGTVAGANAADLDIKSGSGKEAARAEAGEDVAEAPPHVNDSETETENLAVAALENQDKSFPQMLHEILATTECQSILHWLPDGFSFLIVDKQRFSSEILPQYFREALFNSFIRKLNRWGFRRVKSRFKGEESSFAHRNFVRDKPWLCMKMRCKSKPSYHKVPSASAGKMKKNTKKKAKQQSTATAFNSNTTSKSLATPAPATAGIVVSAKAPPPFLATNGNGKGTVKRNNAFVPTVSIMAASEHEPLPLSSANRNPTSTLPKAPAPAAPARFLPTADSSTIRERQHQLQLQRQHQHLAYHQQLISHERQIFFAQVRQLRHLQVELQRQRLNEKMSSHVGDQFASSRNRQSQSAMLAQYARGMLNNTDNYHGEGRK